MIELQRTGFFREMPHGEPTDPSLAEARNPTATPHEERVAAYLEAGHVHTVSTVPARDVFEPGKVIGPAHYLTDGKFVWPGDLAYYVRTYHVRLPGAFIEHMLGSGWTVPTDVDLATLSLPPRPAGDAAPGGGESDLSKAWSDFVGAARDALNSPDGDQLRAQLSSMGSAASRFVESIAPPGSDRRKRIADETALFKSTVNEVGNDAARAAGAAAEELRGTLGGAGERVRSKLSSSLRALSDWLEKPHEERSSQVQSFLSSLQTKLDAAVAKQREGQSANPPSSEGSTPAASEPAKPDASEPATSKPPRPGDPDDVS